MNKDSIQKIVQLLVDNSRRSPHNTSCSKYLCAKCQEQYYMPIEKIVLSNEKIQFILPGFPAKSPNPEKTAGELPDLGEKLALKFLNSICEKITAIYSSGAEIFICSDGRVFNDLLSVKDEHVSSYANGIKEIINENSLNNLKLCNLESFDFGSLYNEMRSLLVKNFAESLEVIKQRMLSNFADLYLFNGIHRFIYEDYVALNSEFSKNKLKKITKDLTYKVIQRSNAWSNLLEKEFPNAIRLSIHPQLCGSKKIGIALLPSKNTWATPWHRVVLQTGKNYCLVHKKDAVAIQAKTVYENNQFSHYQI